MSEVPTETPLTSSPTESPDLADEFFMALAFEEARCAEREDEVPVGCVIEQGGVVLAGAHNQPIGLLDATGHAEILALRRACERAGNYRLPEATLYVTVEPCVMCTGAILHSRLKRVVFGISDPKAGALGSLFQLGSDPRLNHQVTVTSGVLEEKCRGLIQEFFQKKRL